jgi:alpha-amylase/alpha-mannosidase (GH57 family)
MASPDVSTDSPAQLKVCILWHMHQPDYRDPVGGQTLLPWTWLHGLKDYAEMLETVAETKARVTVNLVPSLLEQLERYAGGKDQDRWLELIARPAEKLSEAERQFVVEQFFSVNIETQILPNRRYHQLYLQRGTLEPRAESFSHQDILDLQVCFLLAWTGYHLRQRSSLVSALLERGGLYHEEQKQQLLQVCHEEIARIIDFHRELEAAGLIEITTTPYAHPILPLLCNLQSAWEPSPGLPLPAADFRYPEDARLQVREGLRTAERFFGKRRRGMWPAEGGVSHEAAVLMQEEGALWAATDEDILARSLDGGLRDRSRLYRFYEYEGLPLIFRDRELSDRVGFLYATWKTAEAVADIQQRLRQIARMAPGGTVAIILDGENCWERYAENGYPFLRDLYQMLDHDAQLVMATIGAALEQSAPESLTRLAAGSWIRSDFTTWIGHPEDNVAWQLLYQARRDCIATEVSDALANPHEPLSDLVQELLRAEGSDWFWWFGDEHSSL